MLVRGGAHRRLVGGFRAQLDTVTVSPVFSFQYLVKAAL